jgi:hypothetical protein
LHKRNITSVNPEQAERERTCSIAGCDTPSPDGTTIDLCVEHLRLAWAAYQIIQGTDADTFREPVRPKVSPKSHDAVGWVYFARVGNYVKIGWASDVDRRMKAIKADALYATIPGQTRTDEAAMHRTFSKHRAKSMGNEYFYPVPVLTKYIRDLQSGIAA